MHKILSIFIFSFWFSLAFVVFAQEKPQHKTEIQLTEQQENAIKATFARVSQANERKRNAEILAANIMQAANSEVEAAGLQQKNILLELEKSLTIDLSNYTFTDKEGKIFLIKKPKEEPKDKKKE